MGDAELVVAGTESRKAKLEQLRRAFVKLESHKNSSLHDKTQLEDIIDYFQNLEKSLKEKFEEVEVKEKAFKEKQSETQKLFAEREAAVAVKEHALLDRLQDLKDVAVSTIIEARKKCKIALPWPADTGLPWSADTGENKENKVRTTANGDSNAPIPAHEENLPDRSGESTDAVAVEPRPQLKQLCQEMDVNGLLNFISENQKYYVSLRNELSMALKSASEPARLVLDSLKGFYPLGQPISQGNEKDPALQALRRHCLVLMESVVPLIGTAEPAVKSEIKQQARAIANEWRPKLAAMDLDACHGNSSEAQAFLQLLATFGIASDFNEDDLCKLVLAISRRRQAAELCRSLGLAHKAPGIIQVLSNSGRQLDAVHFAYEFQLTESFPPVPLLKAFLNDFGKNTHETGNTGVQKDAKSQELTALRLVVKCIENYKLQEEYPLGPLQKRVSQLKKAMDKARLESAKAKKPRFSSGYAPRKPVGFIDGRQYPHTVFVDRGPYGGFPERQSYAPATYAPSYGAPSPHTTYGQQVNVQKAYNYPAETALPPNYGSYMGSGLQTASVSQETYTASGYQSAQSNYGTYLGAGLQTPSQPYT